MSRELSGQDLKRFYGEVNSIIWTLVQSVDNNEKLCGVMLIGMSHHPPLHASILDLDHERFYDLPCGY
jgi:hypothetical protein